MDAGNQIGPHSKGWGPGLKAVGDPETIQMGDVSGSVRVIRTGTGYAGGSRLVT